MNLYDAYMTARDRASAPEVAEAMAVFSPAPPAARRPEPPRPPMPRPPMGEPEGPGCGCESPGGNTPCGGPACRCMPSLAMVYAKPQQFHEMYGEAEGLSRGTIFRELDMPFEGGGRR